jgi:hypothetical protein
VTKPDIELWPAHGRTIRQRLHDFLRWADARRRCADLAVPWLGRDGLSAQIIADDKRWNLLRRWLRVRPAGALVLRYGQTTTDIVELTRDHVITGEPADFRPVRIRRSCGNRDVTFHYL